MSTVQELEKKLSRISAQLNTLHEEKIFGSDTLDKSSIDEMMGVLKIEYFKVVDELEAIRKADYSDGELDLIISDWRFKIVEKNNLLSNEFAKKRDTSK